MMEKFVSVFAMLMAVLILGGCPKMTETPKPGAGAGITEKFVAIKDTPIENITFAPPSNLTGTFGIQPELPRGLEMDENSGTVSGTPEEYSIFTTYAITFTGSGSRTGQLGVATIILGVFKSSPGTKEALQTAIDAEITTARPSPNLNIIDTSQITDMSGLFRNKTNFNGDISGWDVSRVTNMQGMFQNASAFNGDISSWDVSRVTGKAPSKGNSSGGMMIMFYGATAFNGDISGWNVSRVVNMNYMFQEASTFNQDVSDWDVSQVIDMGGMFQEATSFNNGGQALDWGNKVSNVTNMRFMFYKVATFNQNVSDWNVGNVNAMLGMFDEATAFNQDISGWDVSSVTEMQGMFAGATSFNNDGKVLDWGNKVKLVTNMRIMFQKATSFNVDISGWNVSEVTNMATMFDGATSFNQNISGWAVGKVEKYDDFRANGCPLTTENTPPAFRN